MTKILEPNKELIKMTESYQEISNTSKKSLQNFDTFIELIDDCSDESYKV